MVGVCGPIRCALREDTEQVGRRWVGVRDVRLPGGRFSGGDM